MPNKVMAASTTNNILLLQSPPSISSSHWEHRSHPSPIPIVHSPMSHLPSLASPFLSSVPPKSRPRGPNHHQQKQRTSLIVATAMESGHSLRRKREGDDIAPGCDFDHWLMVMEFPKDPSPTREQMIDTYLNTLATALGSMEEAKKNMYAFSTTTYTGFQCTVSEETLEKFKGLPEVLWVLPDSYIDVNNKDYGGDKYINGEMIPCKYPTYQPKQRSSKYQSRRYDRRRDGPPPEKIKTTRQEVAQSESPSA